MPFRSDPCPASSIFADRIASNRMLPNGALYVMTFMRSKLGINTTDGGGHGQQT